MKPTGRPPIDPTDRQTVRVCVRIPTKQYDALYKHAGAGRVTVPEVIRRQFRVLLSKGDTRR